jgi:glycosyltransferase involved in cell wall biosynthesis
MKSKKFVSIIWGYSTHMYGFAPEENYHLHALKVAKDLGFKPYAIVKGSKKNILNDPHFDTDIEVIDYKNNFQFFFHVIKLSFQNSLFYVNSYEWQSFIIPFLARKTIFMAHTQPKRQTERKQKIQNFVYKFFTTIRLNNEEEKEFLLQQGTPKDKLFVVPLVVSQDVFKLTYTSSERKDLVYFGNVTEKKNLPTILKAFELVKSTYPQIKLNIIGTVHDTKVTDIINVSPFKQDIVLHGFLPNDLLVQELNKTLIYLNSSFDEGQCVAVYDAALSGCALCLPNIMSFEGVFKDSSLFHDVMDYEKMAQNIIYYLNHPDIIEKFKKHNIEMITKNYSIETIEQKLKELISRT